MQEVRTRAIVLRTRAHGESDKIVTFLTQDWGKITGIAKGAKRSRRRFVNVLELFTHVALRFRPSRSDGLAFILGLWLYYDRRDINFYEAKRTMVVFHCVKCGQLYTALKGNEVAGCPACDFKNSRLKF